MCATVPVEKARNGHIAVSADGSSWIWTPDRSTAFLTRDKGNSWMSCQGLPENIRVIADKVNPKTFLCRGCCCRTSIQQRRWRGDLPYRYSATGCKNTPAG